MKLIEEGKERKPYRPDKLLREFMSEHPKLTRTQIGDRIGVSESCIRKWLNKRRIPQYIHLLFTKVNELESVKTELARLKKNGGSGPTPLQVQDIQDLKAENLALKAKVQRLEKDKDVMSVVVPNEMTMLCDLTEEQKAYLAQTAKVMGFKTITIKAKTA